MTSIEFIAPTAPEHTNYIAVKIIFGSDFDHTALPKAVRAHKMMTIDCTPKNGNHKNETGLKRLSRILKALDEAGITPHVDRRSSNTMSKDDWLAAYS